MTDPASAAPHAAAGAPLSSADVEVLVRRLDPDLPAPTYAHPDDAGADLVTTVGLRIPPGGRSKVPTGVAIALPAGYVGFVLPRSGLADRFGLGILNAPGAIDAGYRGEIMVVLVNHDREVTIELERGDRIAQLVVQRVEHAAFREVAALPASIRGERGHGSTGGFAGAPPDSD